MREAMYYKKIDKRYIQCELCPHYCKIEHNGSGLCRVRKNIDGVLYATGYGKVIAMNSEPIEKKPLYHFYPNQDILSVGSYGCNMTCNFCQNHEISQNTFQLGTMTAEILVAKIKGLGIAFTYNEPFINYEYLYDVSCLLKRLKPDKKIVLVSNGLINEAPLKKILPYVDAFNIDLKGSSIFYKACSGEFDTVVRNLKIMSEKHLEVTTLLVNNHVVLEDIRIFSKILKAIDKKIPYHLSRYFPMYNLKEPETDKNFMLEAYGIASVYMDYVYLGNIDINHDTICKNCKKILISRSGFNNKVLSKSSICDCGYKNNIVGV